MVYPHKLCCLLCGREDVGVYCLDGIPLGLCTDGNYSCLFYQVVKQKRSPGEIFQSALERILATAIPGTLKCSEFLRNLVQYLFGSEKDLFGDIEIPKLIRSFTINWLTGMDGLLGIHDIKLLRRCLVSLPIHSIQNVVNVIRAELSACIFDENITLVTAMRTVLSTSFEKLAVVDTDIHEVYSLWQAHVR